MENVNMISLQDIIFQKIRKSIGMDSCVCIAPIYKVDDIWYINIIVNEFETARALATVLIRGYDLGTTKLRVAIYDKETLREVEPINKVGKENRIGAVEKIINDAFKTNPLFCKTVIVNKSEIPPPSFGDIALVFEKQVIQYYADDISNIYLYTNQIAQDTFFEIINKIYFDEVQISGATKIEE